MLYIPQLCLIHSKDHEEDKRNNNNKKKKGRIQKKDDRELRKILLFAIRVKQLLGSLSNYKLNYKS